MEATAQKTNTAPNPIRRGEKKRDHRITACLTKQAHDTLVQYALEAEISESALGRNKVAARQYVRPVCSF